MGRVRGNVIRVRSVEHTGLDNSVHGFRCTLHSFAAQSQSRLPDQARQEKIYPSCATFEIFHSHGESLAFFALPRSSSSVIINHRDLSWVITLEPLSRGWFLRESPPKTDCFLCFSNLRIIALADYIKTPACAKLIRRLLFFKGNEKRKERRRNIGI